ncbi:MAG: hypothetical protein QG670_1977 [Thermoproteota archaeon]|nr:hypothetical protein [Thermoproteota archaeon]
MSRQMPIETRNVAMAAIFMALSVVLSPLTFTIGPVNPFPFQHLINSIAGVLLGPWYAITMATIVAAIRFSLGIGTLFAFPIGIPGGLVVGLFHRYLIKNDYAALTEPIGTGLIGSLLSAFLVGPLAVQARMVENFDSLDLYVLYFLASSVPGSILGFLVLKAIRRIRIITPEER